MAMLLFGVFFCATLLLSFFFISCMRRWEARHKGQAAEDVVVRDDMRWAETKPLRYEGSGYGQGRRYRPGTEGRDKLGRKVP